MTWVPARRFIVREDRAECGCAVVRYFDSGVVTSSTGGRFVAGLVTGFFPCEDRSHWDVGRDAVEAFFVDGGELDAPGAGAAIVRRFERLARGS